MRVTLSCLFLSRLHQLLRKKALAYGRLVCKRAKWPVLRWLLHVMVSSFSDGKIMEDAYGEDRTTEEQLVTPWMLSVASGYSLLRNPHHNKGLAFSEKERDAHYLRGLLPPVCIAQDLQEKKIMHNLRQYQVPLQRYMSLMDLQERNERLFYKLLIDNVEELLPIVYTPTVGKACQKYGCIFRHPQGLYISLKEKGKILEVQKKTGLRGAFRLLWSLTMSLMMMLLGLAETRKETMLC